jgi:hypothetical protein
MSDFGQKYVSTTPWLLRVVVQSALIAAIIGALAGLIRHHRLYGKVDIIVFVVLVAIESIFRFAQTRSKN